MKVSDGKEPTKRTVKRSRKAACAETARSKSTRSQSACRERVFRRQ